MFIVRHPPTCNPFSCGSDAGPDAEGKVQSIRVAKFFKDKPVEKIYTSSKKRTRYQADAVSKVSGVPVQEDDRLAPWKLPAQDQEEYDRKLDYYTKNPDEKPNGGDETYNQFADRVKSFHEEHASEPNTVAVTHSKNIMTHRAIAVSPNNVSSRVGSAERNKILDTKVSRIDDKSFKPELIIKSPHKKYSYDDGKAAEL